MDSDLLRPSTSRRNSSQLAQSPATQQGFNDGFEHHWLAKDPASEPTRPKDPTNPPSVQIQESFLDLTATASREDPDRVFIETSPHIFQRKQGGWNARLPDVDIQKHQAIPNGNFAGQAGNGQAPPAIDQTKQDDSSKCIALKLVRPTGSSENKRVLILQDAEPRPTTKAGNVKSGTGKSLGSNKSPPSSATSPSASTHPHQRPALNAEAQDPEVIRRVLWRHSVQKSLSIRHFLRVVDQSKAQGLSDSEYGLIKRLTTRLERVSQRSFVGGRYLVPLALRYDNQDVSKYNVDKTCIFFSFPYLCLDGVELRDYYTKQDVEHPPRTLLQSHYRLNKTEDRDDDQCVRWLKPEKLSARVTAPPKVKTKLYKKRVKELFFVPQFWGLIIGLDTLITSGHADRETICGQEIAINNDSSSTKGDRKLSLICFLFYHGERLEELIYPLTQCDSCFGLLNKKQQILEFLAENSDPSVNIEPNNYGFWRDDDGKQITFENWSTVLQEGRNKEMLTVRMQEDAPSMVVVSPPGHAFPAASSSASAATIPTATANAASSPALSALASTATTPTIVTNAVSNTKKFTLKTKAFLAWKMQDEFGEEETSPLEERVSKFLRAIYLHLPVPSKMTSKERSKRPQAASEKRAQADQTFPIQQRTFSQLQEHVTASPKLGAFAQEMLDRSKALLLLFIPAELGVDFDSDAVRVFWGAVSEILQEAVRDARFEAQLAQYMKTVNSIYEAAVHIHEGVHCLRSKSVPINQQWQEVDAIADGAILLSAIIDALGSIFHMYTEAVRYVKADPKVKGPGMMSTSFRVSISAKEALEFLAKSRDQLIREADGRDNDETVGPVLTPEAISIAIMKRLVSGMFYSGTVDVIGLYEECLEYLTLQVKYEASRRLLQKINEFSEEVEIVNDVLKQQNNVLLRFRKNLNATTFQAPSIARKLRFQYECNGIDNILKTINDQLRSYTELRDRARQLGVENVQLVETLQDDNSKAIFIFTMVTIVFLPLSFVAGFYGMNVRGINGTESDVRHFWAIALPLTVGIIILCIVVAAKGEDTYFASTRLWRYVRAASLG